MLTEANLHSAAELQVVRETCTNLGREVERLAAEAAELARERDIAKQDLNLFERLIEAVDGIPELDRQYRGNRRQARLAGLAYALGCGEVFFGRLEDKVGGFTQLAAHPADAAAPATIRDPSIRHLFGQDGEPAAFVPPDTLIVRLTTGRDPFLLIAHQRQEAARSRTFTQFDAGVCRVFAGLGLVPDGVPLR
jgi:hypothetical protein